MQFMGCAAARVAPSPPPAGRSVGGGRVRSPSTLSRGRVFVSASTRRSVANAVASPPAADEAEQLSSRLETFDSTRLLIKMIHDAVRTDIPFDDTHVYDSVTARVAKALATWVKDLDGVLPEEFVRESSRGYGRRALHVRDDLSVIVMCWGPGQQTAIHDHDDMWCVECVYDGVVSIEAYDVEHEREDLYRLTPAGTSVGQVGQAGQLIPPHDVHRISCAEGAGQPAVTIHVYGGFLEKCQVFSECAHLGPNLHKKESRSLYFTPDADWSDI
mmetsp:Transcript_10418/g.36999  ORF Transcript_10418/g.36999 Transcript_10418/m.36999 type:complete len:272 (+) Transcript_10418:146-961(+)